MHLPAAAQVKKLSRLAPHRLSRRERDVPTRECRVRAAGQFDGNGVLGDVEVLALPA